LFVPLALVVCALQAFNAVKIAGYLTAMYSSVIVLAAVHNSHRISERRLLAALLIGWGAAVVAVAVGYLLWRSRYRRVVAKDGAHSHNDPLMVGSTL
jgi:hypothetical protein